LVVRLKSPNFAYREARLSWDCINAGQRKTAPGSRVSPGPPFLTSPAPRKPRRKACSGARRDHQHAYGVRIWLRSRQDDPAGSDGAAFGLARLSWRSHGQPLAGNSSFLTRRWRGRTLGSAPPLRDRWFADSPLEGDGFEPSVPREDCRRPVMRGQVRTRVAAGGRIRTLGPLQNGKCRKGRERGHLDMWIPLLPQISTSAPSSMTRSGGMRKNSVGRVAMRARPE
jgi:hypothetical protein